MSVSEAIYGNPARYFATLPTLTDGQPTALMTDDRGRLITVASVTIADAIEITNDAGNPIPVNGTVVIGTSVTPGTGATNLGKAVDSVAGATDTGVAALFVRRDTPVTLTPADADYARAGLDSLGNLWTRDYYAPVYEDNTIGVAKVEQRFSYAQIAAGQATTTVKSGAGFLHSITLNGAATATNVTTVYDNTAGSGTVIAIPAATTATVPTTLTYDVSFSTGLTIVTATANGANMTVSYR